MLKVARDSVLDHATFSHVNLDNLNESIHCSVGKKIVTKALGFMSDETEDDYAVITDSYKDPEGSLEERLTMMAAVREEIQS